MTPEVYFSIGVGWALVAATVYARLNRGRMTTDDKWLTVLVAVFGGMMWPIATVAAFVWGLVVLASRTPKEPPTPEDSDKRGSYR